MAERVQMAMGANIDLRIGGVAILAILLFWQA
jgi:hypothetical protein